MDRARFDELRDAYVLGALTEEERLEFEEYLADQPGLQAEVEELGAVAGLLALYPQEQDPPAELRKRIMGVVQAEAAPYRAQQRQSVLGRLGELLSSRRFALGAAALLLVGLFSWNMLLRNEEQNLQSQLRGMQASQESQTIALQGKGTKQGARAELIRLEGDRAMLVAEDMPPVPEDKTYQIWVIKDEVPEPSGLFRPAEGPVATVVKHPLGGADTVAVTVEPEGGSPRPTSKPILVAQIRGEPGAGG